MQHSILVVDDEKDITDSLERQFRKQYKILKASSGHEALRILNKEKVQLILSDQRMPEMTGVQLFERVQKLQPDAIRILLTGFTDVESVIAAINSGQIYRYLTKPWDPQDLDIVVRKAIETYDLRSELKEKNARLETALQELKTLDQAKTNFMLLIGHELKTPLTTISSFTDLLKEEQLSNDLMKYVDRIAGGASRLQEIVIDVLDIMNAEMGKMSVKKQNQSVNQLVKAVFSDLAEMAKKKSISVKFEGPDVSATIDSKIISKALKKIAHNAIKFADDESVVKVFIDKKDGVSIAVENEGPEIKSNRIEQILKPFSLDEDIMNHSQGMGLGLSVCQSLLKCHGSGLEIDSKKGKTTVRFKI